MQRNTSLVRKKPLVAKKPLNRNNKLKVKSISLNRSKALKRTELKKQNDKAKEMWAKVREIVLQRDNFKCKICGKRATQVHHIHLRSKRKDLLYNLNNLVSLCENCHFHRGSEKYLEQTKLIAYSMNMSIDDLLKYAES